MAQWFLYSQTKDWLQPTAYSAIAGTPSCEDGPRLCAVYADETSPGSGLPNLTPALKDEITTAITSQNGTTNVYMRSVSGEL